MPKVVTANMLKTGVVVYLGENETWVETLESASLAHNVDDLKRFEDTARRAVEANIVTAVYAFDVRLSGERPEPLSVRERIRAAHQPSV